MITYNYFGKEQKIYYEKLDNGFEIYLLPNKHCRSYHIDLVTKYGSEIDEFIPLQAKDLFKLPPGVAHFLEHKMFDMENDDVFSYYAKSGTFVNAGTNYISTRYYVDGKKHYQKNLDYWLTVVFTPFFDEEKIQNEQGIIAEEIKMYDDDAAWVLDYEVKKCLYQNLFQEKISGTVESIKKIDANILHKVYQTFYQPSNMFIVIAGNIPLQKTMDIIQNNVALQKQESQHPIIYQRKKEPKEVVKEYACIKEKVVLPKLCYAFKFDLNDYPCSNKRLLKLYISSICSYLFGDASDFSLKVLEEHLATNFYLDYASFDNIYTFMITAESEYADLFKENVDKALDKIMIPEEDFLRIKKIFLSVIIRRLDNINALSSSVVNMILMNDKPSDLEKEIEMLEYQELRKIISQLDFSNHSFVLMLPKE